jgi:hypothetical protein
VQQVVQEFTDDPLQEHTSPSYTGGRREGSDAFAG